MYFNCMMYFYLYYLEQHVSASNPAILRLMFLIQEYNWSYLVSVDFCIQGRWFLLGAPGGETIYSDIRF
jgi:hypothetical protein